MVADYSNQYQENSVVQADPTRLVQMMFDGVVKFAHRAIKAIDDNDPEAAHNNIMRTYAIIAELMATLNFEDGGEIAIQLEQCYDYMLFLLKEANISKDKEKIGKVLTLIEPLQKAWAEAFEGKLRPELTGSPSTVQTKDDPATEGKTPPQRKNLDLVG